MNIDTFEAEWMGPESLSYSHIKWIIGEVQRLQMYSNVLEKLMDSLDSRDESDWLLLETIDELMKAEGIPRGDD